MITFLTTEVVELLATKGYIDEGPSRDAAVLLDVFARLGIKSGHPKPIKWRFQASIVQRQALLRGCGWDVLTAVLS